MPRSLKFDERNNMVVCLSKQSLGFHTLITALTMVAKFFMFSSLFVCIRIRTVINALDKGDTEHALKVLEDTINSIETLPHDYHDIDKELVLRHLDMASMLITLEVRQEAYIELKKGRSVFRNFYNNMKMAQKTLLSHQEEDIGRLDALPHDVRGYIFKALQATK